MVLIQPVQPVIVTIKKGDDKLNCKMISLSETELEISSSEYMDQGIEVLFYAKYFRGRAIIKEIKFARFYFTYKLGIDKIQFQPGLIINNQL